MPRPTRTFLMREPRGGRRFERLNVEAPVEAGAFPLALAPALGADLRLPRDFLLVAISLFLSLIHYFYEVTYLVDHAADRRRVFALDGLVHAPEAETADRCAHVVGAADEADHPLDFDFAAGF